MTTASGDAMTIAIEETYITDVDGTRRRNYYALFMWAISGILMWWQMPKVRMWGDVTLLFSLGIASVLGYAMYAVFTN
jgi:hypothetical protein